MNKKSWEIISKELFQVTLSGYLMLLVIETWKEGFASNFINLNILLLIIVLSGIGTAIFEKNKQYRDEHTTDESFIVISLFAGILTGFIVYFEVKDLGVISVVISGCAAILIFLFPFIFLDKNK